MLGACSCLDVLARAYASDEWCFLFRKRLLKLSPPPPLSLSQVTELLPLIATAGMSVAAYAAANAKIEQQEAEKAEMATKSKVLATQGEHEETVHWLAPRFRTLSFSSPDEFH